MVTLQRRFNPIYTSFLQLADQIGTPFVVDAQYTLHTPDPSEGWRGKTAKAGGGCVIDMGYHLIDMILWYFGQPDRILADLSVSARPDREYDAEDTALIHFAYVSGLYGSLLISRFIGPKREQIRLVGSKGIVQLERGRVQRLTNRRRSHRVSIARTGLAVRRRLPGGLLLPRHRPAPAQRERPGREPGAHELYRSELRVRPHPRLRQPEGATGMTTPQTPASALPDVAGREFSLALHGGEPAVAVPGPHFTWPPIDEETVAVVVEQLKSSISIYDRSAVVAELEGQLARYFGVKHAVLTSSGTAALYDLYSGCRIRPGDEVIVPAYGFFATVTPLLHLGAVPVLADCDEYGNLDPADVGKRITDRTFAIAVTHLWGMPADVAALRALADEHEILLLEDGSHAHGASVDDKKVGTFGRGAAFSMNGPKPLSAGEGGFVLTDDDETYYLVLLHGQYNKRCRSEIPKDHRLHEYAVTGMGLKHRIHPLAASIAIDQLYHADDYIAGRQRIARVITEGLRDVPGIRVATPGDGCISSWYGLILQYQPDELDGLAIERYFEAVQAEGCCEADRPGSTCPLHLLPLFQGPEGLFPGYVGGFGYQPGDFPRAEDFHMRSIKLPVWHREEDLPLVGRYVEAFHKVSASYRRLLR